MIRIRLIAAALGPLFVGGCHVTDSHPTMLTANIVDPQSVDAVSTFNSCSGHAFPETNSPNSGKNYFWPNSTNFSTNGVLQEFAACDGTVGQNSDDTSANEQDRGNTVHLYCAAGSTSLRYFHITLNSGILGSHVSAGEFLGYATMLNIGQTSSGTWQNSSNFDIAVSDGNDNTTVDYFAKLDGPTFAAWSARGLTSLSQTINPGNPTCTNFDSNPGSPDVFSFSPVR